MPTKRKQDFFDPNKSDSNDTDFDPSSAAPRRSTKKSRKSTKGGSQRAKKRARYGGSDISDDDLDDSLEDEVSFEESEEEEVEMNEHTGRAVRKATKNAVSYQEDSNSEVEEDEITGDMESDSDEPKKQRGPGRKTRAKSRNTDDEDELDEPVKGSKSRAGSRIITLKIGTPNLQRATRATSAARTTRARASAEPTSAGLPPRRTRARTEEGDVPISLSDSGRHVIQEGHDPEPIGRRPTRGSKGVATAATIKEEIHETSSYEQQDDGDITMATEIQGTDEQDEPNEKSDVPEAVEDEGDEAEGGGQQTAIDVDDDDEDDEPITRGGRTRSSRASLAGLAEVAAEEDTGEQKKAGGRLTRGSKSKQKKSGAEASSDFEPNDDPSDEEISASDASPRKSKSGEDDYASSRGGRGRGRRGQGKSKSTSRHRKGSVESAEETVDPDELAEEIQELKGSRKRKARDDSQIAYERTQRKRKQIDYSIKPMTEIYAQDEELIEEAATPTRRGKAGGGGRSTGGWQRPLFTAFGPFGGGGGKPSLIGGPWGTGATGGVDSDSSDDENMHRPSNVGGNFGMTPTSAIPPGLLPGLAQTNNAEGLGVGATPNVGKIKSQKALADADPLGVDQNVDFSKVGGLQGHIDQLKEMVQMPLLYPELFLKFHVTPPRGVLFHGPPGTGKTLLARALAAQVGSNGQKITFYMRKGADALSKWVGEAERQLRLLFEEARKTQPSIIFFDEIDGLAPVRSSKQEQIHASIVSTLLALMDGMDGRGQVIVIGATNRPDNIDPALRRPGRFDREFYFPLPDIEGRKSIINIHTKDWGIDDGFKDSLAHVTKGYGGADLRALCTEAALNAIQRTFPQIYSSNDKLLIDADKIKVTAKDFMLSVKKMIPSSERATSSGAVPLPKVIEPLLNTNLKRIQDILDGLIPIKKKTTALQEAMYEQYEDADHGFGRETLQQEFEKSRVFRPRLLICGEPGQGQAYLGGAILNHFEGLHVQSFDLPTIFSDSTRSAEGAIVQLFAEVKRHKPSVIYLPGVDNWYHTLSDAVITTFLGLLKAIPPTDPVLVLGIADSPADKIHPELLRDLFGFSRNNRYLIQPPTKLHRANFFEPIITYAKKAPKDFPDPLDRKKRQLEVLPLAPVAPPKPPTKEEIKALKKRDHQLLNALKIQIQPIMDQIQKKYRKFRNPVIPDQQIQYLLDEQDPMFVRPDIPQFRPYEIDTNKDGVQGFRETASGKFFFNLETTTIEERLSNGFYARPKDFLADIRSLAKDAKNSGDKQRTLQANELLANVEVDMGVLESNPMYADCENVYQRQLQRAKERDERRAKRAAEDVFNPVQSDVRGDEAVGPLTLGEAVPGQRLAPINVSSGMSNGHSASASNGTSAPFGGEDVHMAGTDDHASQNSPMLPPSVQRSQASGGATRPNTQVSQVSAWQPISHGTSPSQLYNDASTTTSGKKTSDGWSTQATNGVSNANSDVLERGHDSDLPDTQPGARTMDLPDTQGNTQNTQDTSSEEWLHSQAHGIARGLLRNSNPSQASSGSQASQTPAVPPFNAPPRVSASSSRPSGFANLLNDSPAEPVSPLDEQQMEEEIIDESLMEDLHKRLTEGSSGCSVEQLEQVNRELMEELWKMRGQVNRNMVAVRLTQVFNATIDDIEEMQKVASPSQPSQIYGRIL